MAEFVEAGSIDDISSGEMREISVSGQEILLANIDGKYYAAANRCPHRGGKLSEGKLEGAIVTCPLHGSQFDLTSGKVVRWLKGSGVVSAIGKIAKHPTDLETYRTQIENGKILVKI